MKIEENYKGHVQSSLETHCSVGPAEVIKIKNLKPRMVWQKTEDAR